MVFVIEISLVKVLGSDEGFSEESYKESRGC